MLNRREILVGASAAAMLLGPLERSEAATVVGITKDEIRFGNTMAYSGPASPYGAIGTALAAYFQSVNDLGGVNGRRLTFISYDDGFSPPKTLEMVRKLVEQDEVAFLAHNLGTACNTAIYRYLNRQKVPHLFIMAPTSKFADPKNSPWTISWAPSGYFEATVYARYLQKEKPNSKIAILYQNDDFGKDYLRGLEVAFGDRAQSAIVSRQTYEVTDPTVDSQMLLAKASGADVFVNACTGKFASLAFRKLTEMDWNPLHILNANAQSVETVLKPVGLGKAAGIISTAYMKDPSDAQWQDDSGVKEYFAWAKKYAPQLKPHDFLIVFGYSMAQTMVAVLTQCGGDLSRENIMRQTLNVRNLQLPMLLPGITIDTSEEDYSPISAMAIQRFDGTKWVTSPNPIRKQ